MNVQISPVYCPVKVQTSPVFCCPLTVKISPVFCFRLKTKDFPLANSNQFCQILQIVFYTNLKRIMADSLNQEEVEVLRYATNSATA